MVNVPRTPGRPGADAAGPAPAGSMAPAIPLAGTGRIGRFRARMRTISTQFVLWLSTIGTMVMLLFQFLYSWSYWPTAWLEGGTAWAIGMGMLLIYTVSKMPHIFGQEPGDWPGLLYEVMLLGMLNFIVVVIFLTRVYDGMPYPPGAVGISLVLGTGFLTLMIVQIIATVRLSMRTWSDQTGMGV